MNKHVKITLEFDSNSDFDNETSDYKVNLSSILYGVQRAMDYGGVDNKNLKIGKVETTNL